MATVTTQQEDALLCHFYQQRDDNPVTLEELERTYPRISRHSLGGVGAALERKGLIEYAPPAGHRITAKGIEAYLSDLDD